jgi:predicted small secreted protein
MLAKIQIIFVFLIPIFLAGCNTATSYGQQIKTESNGDITNYIDRWNIPEYVKPQPNQDTIEYYGLKVKYGERQPSKYLVEPSGNPRQLEYNIKKSKLLTREIKKSSLLSYLYYDSGKIIYKEKSPANRFGNLLQPGETYHSNSMGKSLVSYVTGHAICEGYIDSVDSKLDDWDVLKGTLYGQQQLISLLNMNAKDNHVVDDVSGLKPTGRWYNSHTLKSIAERELKDTQPTGRDGYHYNGLVTNIILNYTIHKAGDNFIPMLRRIFNEKVKVENKVYFNGLGSNEAWYQFHATPEDYMRISIAIMEDWQDDTCVGQYLKNIYDRKISKDLSNFAPIARFQKTKAYAGQFHVNYASMNEREVLGMDGYGGQAILIDTSNSRIVVVNTIHTNYDWNQFVYNVIKNGEI